MFKSFVQRKSRVKRDVSESESKIYDTPVLGYVIQMLSHSYNPNLTPRGFNCRKIQTRTMKIKARQFRVEVIFIALSLV